MKKYLVIFFVSILTQSVLAQNSSIPSKEWKETVKEVVLTSGAWKAVNEVVPGGIAKEMVNDKMWEDILFAYPTHAKLIRLKGDYTLLDGKNTLFLKDTTLQVWASDLSVPFYIPPGVDVSDPKFMVPTFETSQKRMIIKSYTPSGQGQDALADAKKSLDESSADVAKLASVEWVKKDSSFITTMNGKEYLFQLDSVGKWASTDPDAPKVIKAGNRKNDPSFVFDKNGELVASNKRNGYKFGMGNYAGYRNNYYRNAFNGRPLGGGYASAFYPSYAPVYGGGWNNYGGGYYGGNGFGYSGCGFSAGLSINFGWSSGCGYANNYYYQPNRWASGGPAVWNGYELVAINSLGSGLGWSYGGGNYGGGYYDSGCSGCKSNQVASDNSAVETEEFIDLASADEKSYSGSSKSLERESFIDLPSTKDLRTESSDSKVVSETKGPIDLPMASRDIPLMELPASHSSTIGRRTASNSGAKPVVDDGGIKFPRSHGVANPERNSNNTFASTSNNDRRQGNVSVQSVQSTKPRNDQSSRRVATTTSRGNENGRVNPTNRIQTQPSRNHVSASKPVYVNPNIPRGNNGNMNRVSGPKPQRGGSPNVRAQRVQQRSAPPMRSAQQPRQAKPMRQANSGQKGR